MPDELTRFLKRLETARERPLNEKLGELISPSAYQEIIDYFLIKENANLLHELSALKPGNAYRLDKKVTGLPRTLNILCSPPDGELKLILETKSKLANNQKQRLPKTAGTFKSGKPAWRIDSTNEIEYFNLVAKLKTPEAFVEMKNEVAISQYFASNKMDVLELGKKFSKEDPMYKRMQPQVSVYSIIATGDLKSVLMKEQKKFSKEQKEKMMLTLLEGLKLLEKHGLVHRDIKPANILATGDLKNGYELKISDFGLAAKEGDPNSKFGGSPAYLPPELSPYFKDFKGSLGYAYFSQSPSSFRKALSTIPNKTSDAWAMGMVFCQLYYGFMPKSPHQVEKLNDPLITGLLNPNKNERLTADQAIQILQKRMHRSLPQPILYHKNTQKNKRPFQNKENIIIQIQKKLNNILDKNINNIEEQYSLYRKEKIGIGKWTIKNQTRNKQIEALSQAFSRIKNNNKLSTQEKVEAAYHTLSQLQLEIKAEKNLFPSALNKLCEKIKTELNLINEKKSHPPRLPRNR